MQAEVPLADNSWLLVRTQPQREPLAASYVRRQADCYLPTFWDGRLQRRMILFASYLFVQCERFGWLNSLPGVAGVIHFGEQPARVPAKVIAALRSRENAHGNVVLPSQEELSPGDSVKLLHGPFAEKLGLYQGMSNNHRVCVLITFLNQYTPVYVEREAVERVAVAA